MAGPAVSRPVRVERWLRLAGLFLVTVLLTLQLYRAGAGLSLDQTLDYGEPFVAHAATHPGTWFGPLDRAPYLVTNYPPAYLVATGVVARFLPGHPFLPGRLVSLASLLVAAALVALLAREEAGGGAVAGLLAAGLFALSPYAQWGFLARVDTLGVALSLGAVWAASRERRGAWLAGAALLCVGALATKQTFVAAPLAIALFLAWRREWRALASFLGWAAAAAGLVAAWLVATYGAGPVWRHLVVYNANGFELSRMMTLVRGAIATHALVVVLAVAAFVYRRPGRAGLLVAYAAVAALVSLTAGKIGSNYNYFLEPLAAASALAAAFAAGFLRASRGTSARVRAMLLVALCVQAVAYATPASVRFRGWEAVRSELAGVPGPILAGDAGFDLVADRPIPYQPFVMKQLIEQGVVPADPLLEPLARGAFARVVLSRSPAWREYVWTRGQLRRFDACYRVSAVHGDFEILLPDTDAEACRSLRAEPDRPTEGPEGDPEGGPGPPRGGAS